MRFCIYDSDGNRAMDEKGYRTLNEAVDAASALALYIWPEPEIGTIRDEHGAKSTLFAEFTALPVGKFLKGFGADLGVHGVGGKLAPRVVRITYADALMRQPNVPAAVSPGRELPVFTVGTQDGIRGALRLRVGSAEVRRDGSIAVVLDALPVNGTLTIGGAS